MSVLPVPDVEASRQIGRGAVVAMLAVAAESPVGAVIEGNFYRSVAVDEIGRLPAGWSRSSAGATRPSRGRVHGGAGAHAGHFDGVRSIDELWNDEIAEPVAGGWPLLEVSTDRPVDVVGVVTFIRTTTD